MSLTARRTLSASLVLAMMLTIVQVAQAYPRPGDTQRVSLAHDGQEGDGRSIWPTMSADGRFVSFESLALNLVPGDTNGNTDVFVHDRSSGELERVSVTSTGAQANNWSTGPASMSADGRYVGFESGSTNIVPGDTNRVGDVFVRDREAGITERISVSSSGEQAGAFSWGTSMSADGRFVAFESISSNLVEGDTNGHWDVFVRDRQEGTTSRVSVSSEGTQGSGVSRFADISADGRFVAFESGAPDLVPLDTNGAVDVFVHDRQTGVTERVSVADDGSEGSNDSTSYATRSVALSADGRFVAFHSLASNLVPNDTNEVRDVFVRDRELDRTERVSVSGAGAEGDGYSGFPWLSADGRYVGFHSNASNLVRGDLNGDEDVFLHDRQTASTELISIGVDGAASDRYARFPSLSADGRHVAFVTLGSNLVSDDTNDEFDIFVRDRGPGTGVGGLTASVAGEDVAVNGWAAFSGGTLSRADDAADDAASGAAGPAGAEMTGAELVYRPEQEDVLLRLRVTELPAVAEGRCAGIAGCWSQSSGAGAPGTVYGLSLVSEETRYEIRALRVGATAMPPSQPLFALYRCEQLCSETARLQGGIGSAATEVRVAVPLKELAAKEGSELTAVQAFTAAGEAAPGELLALDRVDLPNAAIPSAEVTLGVASPGTREAGVAFDTPAELVQGSFAGSLQLPPASGSHEVWARACLGTECGAASTLVDLGPDPDPTGDPTTEPTVDPTEDPAPDVSSVGFTERSHSSGQYSDPTLLEAGLTDSSGEPIEAAELTFTLTGPDSSRTFAATTDGDGIATVDPILTEKPGAHQLTVRFAGDDSHEGSADVAIFVVEKEDSRLSLDVEGNGSKRTLTARLFDEDAPADGLPGRTVVFYADDQEIGSGTTDDGGIAALEPPPRYRGGKHLFEVRFPGDESYLASSDRAQT